jgi:hypothetical protein
MSYTGTRFGKEMGKAVRVQVTGNTMPPSPFRTNEDIERLAAEWRNGGSQIPPGSEAAGATGVLYLMYGFGGYGSNGYGR